MKTVLVTGAGSGVGLAVSQELLTQGFSVLAAVMPGQDTSALGTHDALAIIEADLFEDEDIDELVEVVHRHGRLDCVISNAGIAVPGPLELVSSAELRAQFQVNTFAPIRIIQGLLPLLRASRGRILIIGAGQARVCLPCGGPYGASKATASALMDALRAEVSSFGIEVSVIEPGAIKTGILQSSREKWAQLLAQVPAGIEDNVVEKYAISMERTFNASARAFETAIPPDEFAKRVARIVVAKTVKPRYLVGREAKALAFVARLPDRLRASLMRKML